MRRRLEEFWFDVPGNTRLVGDEKIHIIEVHTKIRNAKNVAINKIRELAKSVGHSFIHYNYWSGMWPGLLKKGITGRPIKYQIIATTYSGRIKVA